jgi:hypothetical protein
MKKREHDTNRQINIKYTQKGPERGFILITTLLMISLLLSLLTAYMAITSTENKTYKHSRGSTVGFYASEAALNIRAENIRSIFVGFNRPTGTSPTTNAPCTGSDQGSGNYICRSYTFNKRTVNSFVQEHPSNPVILTIPPGERYQRLQAQEYRYTTKSRATNNLDELEADLELQFKSRLVPLFQFAAFYNKDLEILPGPPMTLSGPVHTNGELYLYSDGGRLEISGQVTTAGNLYRGAKNSRSPNCNNSPVRIMDPAALRTLIPVCPSRTLVTATDIAPFNGMIQTRVPPVTVPGPEVFDPNPGAVYWDKADLRLVMTMNTSNSPVGIEVRNADNTVNTSATTTINGCAGAIATKAVGISSMHNFRENKTIQLLDMDVQGIFDCLKSSNWFGTSKLLSDGTEGGIVFYATVRGPQSTVAANNYGIRVRNAATLQSTSGTPAVLGFTIVSDQAAYIQGNFNSNNKIPAAVMADSLNVLSNNWNDANSSLAISSRVASNTTINSAFLAGTDTTGGIEGAGGQNGYYNGGLENYPRFHENWSSRILLYRGSFVSLGRSLHVNGRWSSQSYNPPNRDWNYDTSFNDARNLPPITPRFVYLRQELFVRDFDRSE